MKQLRFALLVIGILILSVIAFYTFNLIFIVVANHAALDIVILAGIPMILLFINLMIGLVAAYRFLMKKGIYKPDLYYVRYYAYVIGAISLVGLGMSIFTGTAIYGSFVKDYVFKCYPLIMLISFVLMLTGCVYLIVSITKKIKTEKIEKTYKGTFVFGLREAGISILAMYALERLGAFVLIPFYWSSYDSVYSLPYLIQLLVPTLVVVTYILHEDFFRNRKLTFILSSSLLAYSLFSLIYMVAMSKGNYPLTINSLSPIQQFERLVCYPISAIILYGVSLLIPFLNALNNGILYFKEKKANK